MSLIRFSFQNNHGNQSSVEPYYSPQSDELNSDDTIFRGSHRSCYLKKENTCVGVSFFRKKRSATYWRKKNILFTLCWKERSWYDILLCSYQKCLYKIWFWNFLAQRKSSVKLVKDIFKRLIIDVGFTSCLTSIRLTYQGLISKSFCVWWLDAAPRIEKHKKVRNLISVKIVKNATWIGDIEVGCPVRALKCHSAQLLVPLFFKWLIFISTYIYF